MDSLTHTVLGACLGQVLAGKKIGKKAMLWGAIANNIPDIDVITSAWMGQADSLLAHRGFTHSILFAVLFSPLIALLFSRIYKKTSMQFGDWLIIFASGNLIHILIDSFTTYGTGWFEPFDHYRVSFDLIFVADPFFTISLLVAAIALLIMKKNNPNRNRLAKSALTICILYLFFTIYNKHTIDSNVREQIAEQQIQTNDLITTPTPLNNFLWYIIAKNDSGFYVSYQSVFDHYKHLNFTFHNQNKNLLDSTVISDPDLKKLIRFSKDYYVLNKIDNQIYFSDVRFGQISGWNNPESNFVFRYILNKGANNDLVIQRGRFEGSGKKALRELWKRMWGK